MKPIVSFDLDMTLLDHEDWKIPASAQKAVELLRKKYYIVLATGRDMDNYYSREFKGIVRPDAIIHMNGTKITVGEKLIYDHRMDTELLRGILAFAEEKGYGVGVTVGDEDFYTSPESVEANDYKRWNESGRNFKNPWLLPDMGVRTLSYVGNAAGVRDIEAHFPQVRLPMFSNGTGADIIETEASKAWGLKRLCQFLGSELEKTVAFGDSMNDYEIVREAGLGIAMGNAIEELKQVADYVTTDIGKDGIWNACVHFQMI